MEAAAAKVMTQAVLPAQAAMAVEQMVVRIVAPAQMGVSTPEAEEEAQVDHIIVLVMVLAAALAGAE